MFYELQNYWYLAVVLFVSGFLLWLWMRSNNEDRRKGFFNNNYNYKKTAHLLSLKIFLLFLALSLLLLALWRPQWGQKSQIVSSKGIDIVFTVDVSKSMKALDFSQGKQLVSRLDATKFLIDEFIKKLGADRFALVEFAGESFVASPLTLDHSVFSNFLQDISSDDIGKQGTNLAEALEISLARLQVQDDIDRTKAILLFSDGDETIDSDTQNIAKLAKDKNIIIYTIGIGSKKGMPIPEGQDAFGHVIYKKWHGQIVQTKLNSEPLKQIASITNGEYFHAESMSDLKRLQKKLSALPAKILKDKRLSTHQGQYWYFSLFGLVFFVLGFLLPKTIIKPRFKFNYKIHDKK